LERSIARRCARDACHQSVHRFGCARSRSNSPTISRRRRFNSLTGSKTSPVRIFQFAELERRAAQTAELFAQFSWSAVAFPPSPAAWRIPLSPRSPEFVARNERERFAGAAVDFNLDGPLKFRRVARETLAQAPVQFGIVVFHNLSPTWTRKNPHRRGRSAVQSVAGREFETRLLHFVNPSAFLLFVRPAGVEHHAVAGFERARPVDDDAVADDFFTSPRNTPRFLPKRAWTSF
jgi:hypothetical protein